MDPRSRKTLKKTLIAMASAALLGSCSSASDQAVAEQPIEEEPAVAAVAPAEPETHDEPSQPVEVADSESAEPPEATEPSAVARPRRRRHRATPTPTEEVAEATMTAASPATMVVEEAPDTDTTMHGTGSCGATGCGSCGGMN